MFNGSGIYTLDNSGEYHMNYICIEYRNIFMAINGNKKIYVYICIIQPYKIKKYN